MKKITDIPFLEISSIPQLIKNFLRQEIEGFEDSLFTEENIEKQFKAKQNSFSSEKRNVLVGALFAQVSDLNLSEKQKENLDSLRQENTFTVTTGHQLNLFTGPSFFIFKILQTIKTAEFLNENFPDRKTVPIFWMATEDHDFDEINHFKIENSYYSFNGKSGGAVGRINIEDDFFISEFEQEFKDSVFGTELILLMKKAYKKGNTLAQATRFLVQGLFAEFGLLVIDGDDPALKVQMKEIFSDELENNSLLNSTKNRVDFLTQKYGKVQVNPREINLFYLSDTRDRIENEKENFVVVDKNISFSKREILNQLQTHPEKFSPNALMRPVYQENILPNIAYIGGNAEIMYWLELKDYFAKINIPFPLLIPRSSILFVTEKNLAKTEKLGLKITDFFRNFATVTNEILLENNNIQPLLDKSETLLENQFNQLTEIAGETEKTFGNLVQAEKTRQLKAFKRMRKRLLRAEKIKQQEKMEQLDALFLKIHPGRNWQERVLNFSVFYADHGKEWLQTCYEEISITTPELTIVSV